MTHNPTVYYAWSDYVSVVFARDSRFDSVLTDSTVRKKTVDTMTERAADELEVLLRGGGPIPSFSRMRWDRPCGGMDPVLRKIFNLYANDYELRVRLGRVAYLNAVEERKDVRALPLAPDVEMRLWDMILFKESMCNYLGDVALYPLNGSEPLLEMFAWPDYISMVLAVDTRFDAFLAPKVKTWLVTHMAQKAREEGSYTVVSLLFRERLLERSVFRMSAVRFVCATYAQDYALRVTLGRDEYASEASAGERGGKRALPLPSDVDDGLWDAIEAKEAAYVPLSPLDLEMLITRDVMTDRAQALFAV
jgi:hypothetical protein